MNKAKKYMTTTFKVLGNVIFGLCLILALVVTFVSLGSSTDNNVPGIFGYSPMAVKSDSMNPVMKKGDLIFVNKKVDAFVKDDIITFYTTIEGAEVLNTHRIVEVIPAVGTIQENYKTKGDNNPTADDPFVMKDKVIGKYTGTRLVGIGAIVTFASSSLGFFLLIILPLLGYFIYHVVKVVLVSIEYKKGKKDGDVLIEAKEEPVKEVTVKAKKVVEVKETVKKVDKPKAKTTVKKTTTVKKEVKPKAKKTVTKE